MVKRAIHTEKAPVAQRKARSASRKNPTDDSSRVLVSAENWHTFTDRDVASAFSGLFHDGYAPIEADNLIRYFHFTFQSDMFFDACGSLTEKGKVFLNFIEFAFSRYVDGKSIAAAFGLKKSPGQRTLPDHSMRNMGIAASVVLSMRSGARWQDAIGDVANTCFPDGAGTRACEDARLAAADFAGDQPNAAQLDEVSQAGLGFAQAGTGK